MLQLLGMVFLTRFFLLILPESLQVLQLSLTSSLQALLLKTRLALLCLHKNLVTLLQLLNSLGKLVLLLLFFKICVFAVR